MRKAATIESYDGLIHIFGALDTQLTMLEQLRNDPQNKDIHALLQGAFRCAASGGGSISGLVDFHGFARFCFYSGLTTTRTMKLTLPAEADAAAGAAAAAKRRASSSNKRRRNRPRSSVDGEEQDDDDDSSDADTADDTTADDQQRRAPSSCPDFGFALDHEVTWMPPATQHVDAQTANQARYALKRLPDTASVSADTAHKVFQYLSHTFRASTSSTPVVRFAGFCLALLHLTQIMVTFAFGEETVHQPAVLLRALFGLKKVESFIRQMCVVVPFPEEMMKNTSFLPIELWRWCPALDSVFVYYCASPKVLEFQPDSAGTNSSDGDDSVEDHDAASLLTRARFLQFAMDLGLGSGFDLVAAERIFSETAVVLVEDEGSLSAHEGVKEKQKHQRMFLSFDGFCDAIVRIACITSDTAAAPDAGTSSSSRGGKGGGGGDRERRISLGFDNDRDVGPAIGTSTVPDAVEKFLLAVLGPLFQLATDGADILSARSLVAVPQATVMAHSMVPSVIYSGSQSNNSNNNSRANISNQQKRGQHLSFSSSSSISSSSTRSLAIEGTNIGALGRGVWVYCSVSPVPIHHITPEKLARQQQQQQQQIKPSTANATTATSSALYSRLEFDLAPGESPELVWASADITLNAKTEEYLEVGIVLSAPVFVAVGNTPEQLLYDSEPVHVGTNVLELQTTMIPAKVLELAEAHFAVGCTRTSGLNRHQLFEEGWKYLTSKLAMAPGRFHRNCLGCGPSEIVAIMDRQEILDAIFRGRATRATTETSGRPFMKFPAFLDSLLRLVISHGCAVDAIAEVLRQQLQLRTSFEHSSSSSSSPTSGEGGAAGAAGGSAASPSSSSMAKNIKEVNQQLQQMQQDGIISSTSTASLGGVGRNSSGSGLLQSKDAENAVDPLEQAAKLRSSTSRKSFSGSSQHQHQHAQHHETSSSSSSSWNNRMIEQMTAQKAQQDLLRQQLREAKDDNVALEHKLEDAQEATATLSSLAEEFFAVSDLAFEQVMKHVPDKSVKRLVNSFRQTVQHATEKHHDLLSNVSKKLTEAPKHQIVSLDEMEAAQQQQQQEQQQDDNNNGAVAGTSSSSSATTAANNKTTAGGGTASSAQRRKSSITSSAASTTPGGGGGGGGGAGERRKSGSAGKPAYGGAMQASVADMIDAMKEIARGDVSNNSSLRRHSTSAGFASSSNNNNNNTSFSGFGSGSLPAAAGGSGVSSSDVLSSSAAAQQAAGAPGVSSNNHNQQSQQTTSSNNNNSSFQAPSSSPASPLDQQQQQELTRRKAEMLKASQDVVNSYQFEIKSMKENVAMLRQELSMKEGRFALEKNRLENEKYELKDQVRQLNEKLKLSQETTTMLVLRSNEVVAEAQAHSNQLNASSAALSRQGSASFRYNNAASAGGGGVTTPSSRGSSAGGGDNKQPSGTADSTTATTKGSSSSRSRTGGTVNVRSTSQYGSSRTGQRKPHQSTFGKSPSSATAKTDDTMTTSPTAAATATTVINTDKPPRGGTAAGTAIATTATTTTSSSSPNERTADGDRYHHRSISGTATSPSGSSPLSSPASQQHRQLQQTDRSSSRPSSGDSGTGGARSRTPGGSTGGGGDVNSPTFNNKDRIDESVLKVTRSNAPAVAGVKEHVARLRARDHHRTQLQLNAAGLDDDIDVMAGTLPNSVLELVNNKTASSSSSPRMPATSSSGQRDADNATPDGARTPPPTVLVLGSNKSGAGDGNSAMSNTSITGRSVGGGGDSYYSKTTRHIHVTESAARTHVWHALRHCRIGLATLKDTVSTEMARSTEWMRKVASHTGAGSLPAAKLVSVACQTESRVVVANDDDIHRMSSPSSSSPTNQRSPLQQREDRHRQQQHRAGGRLAGTLYRGSEFHKNNRGDGDGDDDDEVLVDTNLFVRGQHRGGVGGGVLPPGAVAGGRRSQPRVKHTPTSSIFVTEQQQLHPTDLGVGDMRPHTSPAAAQHQKQQQQQQQQQRRSGAVSPSGEQNPDVLLESATASVDEAMRLRLRLDGDRTAAQDRDLTASFSIVAAAGTDRNTAHHSSASSVHFTHQQQVGAGGGVRHVGKVFSVTPGEGSAGGAVVQPSIAAPKAPTYEEQMQTSRFAQHVQKQHLMRGNTSSNGGGGGVSKAGRLEASFKSQSGQSFQKHLDDQEKEGLMISSNSNVKNNNAMLVVKPTRPRQAQLWRPRTVGRSSNNNSDAFGGNGMLEANNNNNNNNNNMRMQNEDDNRGEDGEFTPTNAVAPVLQTSNRTTRLRTPGEIGSARVELSPVEQLIAQTVVTKPAPGSSSSGAIGGGPPPSLFGNNRSGGSGEGTILPGGGGDRSSSLTARGAGASGDNNKRVMNSIPPPSRMAKENPC